jgi:hypothetical protein
MQGKQLVARSWTPRVDDKEEEEEGTKGEGGEWREEGSAFT